MTGKAGENGQYAGEMGGSSPWTRPSAPGCGHPRPQRAPARSGVSLASGSLSTGSPARRTHLLFKAGETGQCAVRRTQGQGNKCCGPLARAQPSVIMGTEKGCLREADAPVERAELRRRRSLRLEKWSPVGALGRRPCAAREAEDHKRSKIGGGHNLGQGQLCRATKQSSYRQQKSTSSPIQYCVLAK